MTVEKRKLIEVSLPLEVINRESAREKAIRHGHPSTLHLWWSRKPLSTARAVLFAQLVDDPSARPDKYPTKADQQRRREELHSLIEKLVVWENSTDAELFAEAHKEILDSTGGNPPTILDPFAGGGSIPLEAQRLGLNTRSSDLNPVPVVINKALIEIPPKFRGGKPVFHGIAEGQIRAWRNAEGLAADVAAYGQWIRDEAEKRIGDLYPRVTLENGSEAPVVAWIWARTITCPNPRCAIQMPLTNKWWLGKKKGKEAYVIPMVRNGEVIYDVGHDPMKGPSGENDGTVKRTGATCINCRTAVGFKYIREESVAGRLGADLTTVVAEGDRERVYLPPSPEQVEAASMALPGDIPEGELPDRALSFRVQSYGFRCFTDLFTRRQLVALTTFSDLVAEAREKVLSDALKAGHPFGDALVGGGTGALAYADAVGTYLGLAMSRYANFQNSLCQWRPDAGKEQVGHLFARQAIPMVWDFAEANCFSNSAGGWMPSFRFIPKVIEFLPCLPGSVAVQQQSATEEDYSQALISTDPPYYDNIGYSDLSDFFYIWLRRSIKSWWPDLFATLLVPKKEELVANPFRHNGSDQARKFFEDGFTVVFRRAREQAVDDFPITVYYAFKQAEASSEGIVSAGWETLLTGMLQARWMVTGTWPMRSELSNRALAKGTNALASSVVLALRPTAGRCGNNRSSGIYLCFACRAPRTPARTPAWRDRAG